MSGSHSIRTGFAMFHNRRQLTLSFPAPLSDLASFAVERRAARTWSIYEHCTYRDCVWILTSTNSSSLRLAPLTRPRVSLPLGFVCHSHFVLELVSLLHLCSSIHLHARQARHNIAPAATVTTHHNGLPPSHTTLHFGPCRELRLPIYRRQRQYSLYISPK